MPQAQPIRLLLEYVDASYKEIRYEKDECSKWLKKKEKAKLDFPNLPYFIDEDLKLTGFNAILRYLGEKHGFGGKTPKENAEIGVFESALNDLRQELLQVAYSVDYSNARKTFMASFKERLQNISKFLGTKKFAMGDQIKYVDFYLYEILEVCEYFDKSTFCAFPNFVDYKKRFEAIPQINKYMKSKSFVKWPLFTWIASFGGGTIAPPEAS